MSNRHNPLIGWLSLGIYLVVTTPIMPVFAIIMGSIGGEHWVKMAVDHHEIRVVFGHYPQDSDYLKQHNHGALTQSIILMSSESCEDPSQDHILKFHTAYHHANLEKKCEYDLCIPIENLSLHPKVPTHPRVLLADFSSLTGINCPHCTLLFPTGHSAVKCAVFPEYTVSIATNTVLLI